MTGREMDDYAANFSTLLLAAIFALVAAVLFVSVLAVGLSVTASAGPAYKTDWKQQFGPAWYLSAVNNANGTFSHCILIAGFQLAPPLQQREGLSSRSIMIMFTAGQPNHMMGLGVGARWPGDISGKKSRAQFDFMGTGKQTFDLVGRSAQGISFYERWYNRETLRPLLQAMMTNVAFSLELDGKSFGIMPITDGQAKPAITAFGRCVDNRGRKG